MPPQACVLGLVHHPHPANTQLLEDDVVRDGLANLELPFSWGDGPTGAVARQPSRGPSRVQPVGFAACRADDLL